MKNSALLFNSAKVLVTLRLKLKLLEISFGKGAMKRTSVYSWYKRFHGGLEMVRDDPSSQTSQTAK